MIKGYREYEKAHWVTNLAEELHDNGCFHTVHYVSDLEGNKVVPYKDRYFTIMKAIEGREASYAALFDVKKAATTLARFHKAAYGFRPDPSLLEQRPPLLDKWERRLDQFEQISQKIDKRGPQNRLEQVIQSMANEVKRDGHLVVEQMYQMPLDEEMYDAIHFGTLAHRDVASHNFMLTATGSCFLIDLDTVSSDMQLVDLVQMISRTLFFHGYNPEVFLEIVEAYSKIKPLRDEQISMIFQLLRFPDNALREITGVYGKHPGYRVRSVLQLLQMERRLKYERRNFFQSQTLRDYGLFGDAFYGAS